MALGRALPCLIHASVWAGSSARVFKIAEGFSQIALALTGDGAVVPDVRQFGIRGDRQIEIGERPFNVAFG